MPKKLNVNPNQRIDLPDFNRAASEYTSDSLAFLRRKLLQSKKPYILNGFEIELGSAGEITVYNGNAVDRDGNHLNDESQVNHAQTLTLSGASTTFYVEIEFAETESDTDARAFWDPTFVNAAGEPPGKEFSANVATRVTPSWKIVEPVSTSGFDLETNPSSKKIPLAILATDASNEITAPVNPELSKSPIATNLEKDHASGDTKLYCLDTKFFQDGDSITVSERLFVGATTNSSTVISNDLENAVLTISPALSDDFEAGARVSGPGGTPFVRQNDDWSSTHPDQRDMFWRGNTIRGSGLSQTNRDAFARIGRDDVKLSSLKDYIDFLSSLVQELKWGSLREDEFSTAPPLTFDGEEKYYENAGSVQGARTNTISVGNAHTTGGNKRSRGDFNGVDEVPIQAAIDELDDTANRNGKIYLKRGTYTLANPLNINKYVEIIGEEPGATVIELTGANQFIINNTLSSEQKIRIRDVSFVNTSGASVNIDFQEGGLEMTNCYFSDVLLTDSTTTAKELVLDNCRFVTSLGLGVSQVELAALQNSHIKGCVFDESGGAAADTAIRISDSSWDTVSISDCRVTANLNKGISSGVSHTDLKILDCHLEADTYPVEMVGSDTTRTVIRNTYFGSCERGIDLGITIGGGVSLDVSVEGCKFAGFTDKGIHGTGKAGSFVVSSCYFSGGSGNLGAVHFDNCKYTLLSVYNSVFENIGTAGSALDGVVYYDSSSSSIDRTTKIRDNTIDTIVGSNVRGIAVFGLHGAGVGEVEISGNTLSGITCNDFGTCIRVSGTAARSIVHKNVIRDFTNTGASSSEGVLINDNTEVLISDNVISNFTGEDFTRGLYVDSSTDVSVTGNLFKGVSGAANVYGIQLESSDDVHVRGNSVRTLTSSDNTLYGIFGDTLTRSVISENNVNDLTNSVISSPDVKGIHVDTPTDVQVMGNHVSNISMGTAPLDTEHSSYISAEGLLSAVSIGRNKIKYGGSNDPRCGLLCLYSGASTDVTINENIVRCDASKSDPNNALLVEYVASAGDTITDLMISHNKILDFNSGDGTNDVTGPLLVRADYVGSKRFNIVGNHVYSLFDEFRATSQPCNIAVYGLASADIAHVCIRDNLVDNSVRTAGGPGIVAVNCKRLVIANNNVSIGTGTSSINVSVSSGMLISSNLIKSNGSGSDDDINLSTVSDYYVHGNYVEGTNGSISSYSDGSPTDATHWNQLG